MTFTIWFTGLPGSGKTTLAKTLKKYFDPCIWLDGDIFRRYVTFDSGFSKDDRITNNLRAIGVCQMLNAQKIPVIASFVSPTNYIQELTRNKLKVILIYVNTPLDICKKRDPKGLYKLALLGKIKNFTGIDSEYEIPTNPDLILNTTQTKTKENIRCILVTLNQMKLI